ncbi:S66 peptidase family protein [Planococcus sp. ISL-109]|uniref:S66 family peptidase n=1 Tax=Planococcus sp. ISL-109 TaxID=2819166 RepID=UPI001BE73290|nr:S66 peptidase family protein [Planococcus sp. ISL-109]MBT2582094.1 LD-carboxypeptidase [Planococcus sp. ISL-109]
MIRYPDRPLKTIGVTAPSSGVPEAHHDLLKAAVSQLEQTGLSVKTSANAWTQQGARSSSAVDRARQLIAMWQDPEIDAIVPPWGGELLLEILEHTDFQSTTPKWLLGYSDLSLLTLAATLNTGIATAHGTNIIDLRGSETDPTTVRWRDVLESTQGAVIEQTSSKFYQKSWEHDKPTPAVFHLDEPTVWKTASGHAEQMDGRLLGGCIDVIRHLIGTPYGDVAGFRTAHIPGEPVVWYLENCELTVTDLKRSLLQMKYAGWFDNCAGIVFGRSAANGPVQGYTAEDVYAELAEQLNVPIIYDADIGHQPPQLVFVNGAYATVHAQDGIGRVVQEFR